MMSDELKRVLNSPLIIPPSSLLYNPRRVAGDDGAGGDASGDDGAGADDGALADLEAAEDGGVAADGGAAADDRRFELPVLLRLRRAVGARGAREAVVREHHAVA